MMLEMMPLDALQYLIGKPVLMRCVMPSIIRNIPAQKPQKKRPTESLTHYIHEYEIKRSSEWETHNGRHEITIAIPWKHMVIAMQDEKHGTP